MASTLRLYLILFLGAAGLFLGMPNPFVQIPILVLLYPWALLSAASAVAKDTGFARAFRYGCMAGLAGSAACLYWLAIPVHEVGQLPWVPAAACAMLLAAYTGLYGGIFAACAWYMLQKPLPAWMHAVFCGCIWYLLEWIRGWFGSGFPWLSLSAAFAPQAWMTQGAAILGMYGLSGFFVMILAFAMHGKKYMLTALCGLLITAAAGAYRIQSTETAADNDLLRWALIQGNIDQNVKWNPEMQKATVEEYLHLSEKAMQSAPNLLIWPETALPFNYERHGTLPDMIRNFASAHRTAILSGAPAFRYKLGRAVPEVFNRAYLVSAEGQDAGYYEKEHLVPFGEYLPRFLNFPFLEKLLQGVGNFCKGERILPLVIDKSGKVAAGMLICYETIFPELARQRVSDGANVLINISNDAWFGHSSAAEQHLQLGMLRAVEENRYLARATNTGISAFVDPSGRILARSGMFTAGNLVHAIALRREKTIFWHIAPLMPCSAMFLAAVILVYRKKK